MGGRIQDRVRLPQKRMKGYGRYFVCLEVPDETRNIERNTHYETHHSDTLL